MKLMHLCVAALALSTSIEAAAGPFGLEMGMTFAQLKAAGVRLAKPRGSVAQYVTNDPPRPHPKFDEYVLVIDEQLGLCRITAIGSELAVSPAGTELKDEFNSLTASLERLYGAPAKYDWLKRGSVWDQPKHWTTALLKGERNLKAMWTTKPDTKFVPKDNIKAIGVDTLAISLSAGYVTLTYDFNNIDECLQRIKREKSPVL